MRRRTLLFGLACLGVTPAFALHDAKPEPALAAVQGEWRGSLTYRDYSEPKRMVTLPVQVFIALGAPGDLVLHYVFDDGPSKTVFSYDKMRFDFAAGQVVWTTNGTDEVSVCRITSDTMSDDVRVLVFEQNVRGEIKRYTMELSAHRWTLAEDEVSAAGAVSFRNRFAFSRGGT